MQNADKIFTGEFLAALLYGFSLNLTAATVSLILGVAIGVPLALVLRARIPVLGAIVRALLAVLRATPVFVALYFVAAYTQAYTASDAGVDYVRPLVVIVLACLPYIVVYASDQAAYLMGRVATGDHRAAVLVVPAMGRAFLVLLATSGLGAALGLPEAMSVVLATAERIPGADDTLMFFFVMVVLFVVLHQAMVLPFRMIQRIVMRRIEPDRPLG